MTRKLPSALQTPLPMSPATNLTEAAGDSSPTESSSFPKPKIRLECRELGHEGSNVFFKHLNPATGLPTVVSIVLSILYAPRPTNDHIPPTRSVTLILRSMGGVAFTTGLEIDDDHKEIHFSLDYIQSISTAPGAQALEIQGVLVHEMVHAWQWNGKGTAPSGLIEGVADFVRLKAGLRPPHWKKEPGGQWDAGYQHTGYFLDWVEDQFGKGSVRKINATLQSQEYTDKMWENLFGMSVETLWDGYQQTFARDEEPPQDDAVEKKTADAAEASTNTSA